MGGAAAVSAFALDLHQFHQDKSISLMPVVANIKQYPLVYCPAWILNSKCVNFTLGGDSEHLTTTQSSSHEGLHSSLEWPLMDIQV